MFFLKDCIYNIKDKRNTRVDDPAVDYNVCSITHKIIITNWATKIWPVVYFNSLLGLFLS